MLFEFPDTERKLHLSEYTLRAARANSRSLFPYARRFGTIRTTGCRRGVALSGYDVRSQVKTSGVIMKGEGMRSGVVVTGLYLLLATNCFGAVLIDNFSTTQSLITTPGTSGVSTGTNTIGGARVILTTSGTANGLSVQVNQAGSGYLRAIAVAGAAGSLNVSYSGGTDGTISNNPGLGGADLTEGGASNAVRILVRGTSAVALNILIHTTQTDHARITISTPSAGVAVPFTEIVIPFSSFLQFGAGADFSNVAYIIVQGTIPAGATFDIDEIEATTSGDECEIAHEVTDGVYANDLGNNTGTTGDDSSCGLPGRPDNVDEWYRYTATCTGVATADTCRANTLLATTASVFDECAGSELACSAFPDNASDPACTLDVFGTPQPAGKSRVRFDVVAGENYFVRVSSFGDNDSQPADHLRNRVQL